MEPKRILGESGPNGRSRRAVLQGLAGVTALGLAGCLGDDGSSSDSDSTDEDGGESSPTAAGDGTAPVDLRMFPPSHHVDSFRSLSVAYESLALTTTGGEESTFPIEQTVDLTSDSTPTGVPVVEDLAVAADEYEIVEVRYSIDEAVSSDGQAVDIAFTSPRSENVAALTDEPPVIEESSPYVIQTHFSLLSEPWDLSMPTIVLGPGIPD